MLQEYIFLPQQQRGKRIELCGEKKKLRAEIKEQMLDSILHDLYWQGFSRRLLQSSARQCLQRDAEMALGVFPFGVKERIPVEW